jgi:hypothetical protein
MKLNAFIEEIRSQRPLFMPINVVREGDGRDLRFYSYLVDDKSKNLHSKNEFLVNLHQRIQGKLRG